MAMTVGGRLGAYEILGPLGAGGMGEVYRARDARLKRDVALKVLPESFASDPDRLARFTREAEMLAALNHPNIAGIHGLEEAHMDGVQSGPVVRALVMELVEGETLADRIATGPVPWSEARNIARQIAEALEAAHEQGIIHRDLKPANIKLRDDGTVKVLDFGLAKLAEPIGQGSSPATLSPTITSPALMTNAGVLLGTAAYMSPEQAKGRPADRRSDVWAFGCVLFEVLTSKRPFEGSDILETVASVLKSDPDWSALPAALPPTVRNLVMRCLERERRARIGDFSTVLFLLNESETQKAASIDGTASQSVKTRRLAWMAASAALGAILTGGIATWLMQVPAPTFAISRFRIPLPSRLPISAGGRHPLAISPAGTHMVFTADERLYMRELSALETSVIRGTDGGARSPFFSPDGQSIGFWHEGRLKRVSITGGAPVEIAPATQPLGVRWAEDGMIWFGQQAGIMRVPAIGGTPELVIKSKPGERLHGPQPLPGGRALLFTALVGDTWDDAQIVAQSLADGRRVVVLPGGTDGQYLPTGHVVYVNSGTLLAVRFDPETLTPSGGPVSLVEDVTQTPNGATGAAMFAISQAGTLIYLQGVAIGADSKRLMTWVDRSGREEPIGLEARAYIYPRISPDATRLGVTVRDQLRDVHIWHFARGTFLRFTTDAADDRYSLWTPDSAQVLFSSNRDGKVGVWLQGADRPGTARLLATTPTPEAAYLVPTSITPDGSRAIIATASQGGPSSDIYALRLTPQAGAGAPGNPGNTLQPLVKSPTASERSGSVSPDGKWLAYESNESGTFQVYVRSLASIDGAFWPVSTAGGLAPLWGPRKDALELFYVTPNEGSLMRVAVTPADSFTASAPAKLFGGSYAWTVQGYTGRHYDIHPDGRRFIFMKPADATSGQPPTTEIVYVGHWFEELKRLVPVD